MTRLLRLNGKSCILAPLDQAFDVLGKVVELQVALTPLTCTVRHAAARYLAGGEGVSEFPVLV